MRAVCGGLRAVAEIGLNQAKTRVPAQRRHDLGEGAASPELIKFATAVEQLHALGLLALQLMSARELVGNVGRLLLVQNDQHLARYRLGLHGAVGLRTLGAMWQRGGTGAAARGWNRNAEERGQRWPARFASRLAPPVAACKARPAAPVARRAGRGSLGGRQRGKSGGVQGFGGRSRWDTRQHEDDSAEGKEG